MNRTRFLEHLDAGLARIEAWQARWPHFEPAPELAVDDPTVAATLSRLADRLQDNYPFFHPRYAGQMLKPPHPVAMLAYAMAMQINPNNHALDGGPATAALERECLDKLAVMFGLDAPLGHLTSSGTIANLEALWVARSLHPDRAVAFSEQSHYTHARMCEVLGIRAVPIAADRAGRLSRADLEAKLYSERIGTVVATLGTTGLGALDPVHELVELGSRRGFRVHVDAAYGGFYRLLAGGERPSVQRAPFEAIAGADSVVVDPHKHGLQPYGCGCVLFADPSVGRFYRHDSPYTYFSSRELHLGEISLECSRAGAAAAALWATLECLPLARAAGLGPVLEATRGAALSFAARLSRSPSLRLLLEPELDIVVYAPWAEGMTAREIGDRTQRVFSALMADPDDPAYLAVVSVPRAIAEPALPGVVWDAPDLKVFRSCFLKPEHLLAVDELADRIELAVARDREVQARPTSAP